MSSWVALRGFQHFFIYQIKTTSFGLCNLPDTFVRVLEKQHIKEHIVSEKKKDVTRLAGAG